MKKYNQLTLELTAYDIQDMIEHFIKDKLGNVEMLYCELIPEKKKVKKDWRFL